jgi:hypothetical protein
MQKGGYLGSETGGGEYKTFAAKVFSDLELINFLANKIEGGYKGNKAIGTELKLNVLIKMKRENSHEKKLCTSFTARPKGLAPALRSDLMGGSKPRHQCNDLFKSG